MGKTYISSYNELDCLRGIAHKLGGNAASANEIDALRTIVTRLDVVPGNRTVGNMNKVDCLRAIVRHYASATPVPVFSPLDITGLKLWLKADALSLSDADPVGTWPDSSGLGNDATQGTAAKKPTYKVSIINGMPVVRFDGTDDVLLCPAITAATGLSAFAVSKVAVATSFGMTLVLRVFTLELRQNGVTGNMQLLTNGTTSIAGSAGTSWTVHSFTNNGSDLTELWTNGTSNGTQPNSATCGTPTIGARSDSSSPFNGDVAEIILYDSDLADSDRQAVEAYLAAKYGL